MSGVTGDEDPSNAHLRRVPMMDAKVDAPIKGASLDPAESDAGHLLHRAAGLDRSG
jgi:hypothetical protein